MIYALVPHRKSPLPMRFLLRCGCVSVSGARTMARDPDRHLRIELMPRREAVDGRPGIVGAGGLAPEILGFVAARSADVAAMLGLSAHERLEFVADLDWLMGREAGAQDLANAGATDPPPATAGP